MKQVTSVLIGAGNRGANVYSEYAIRNPSKFKVIAVVEPDEIKRKRFAKKHDIPSHLQFNDYNKLFELERIADCVMVCTQDKLHVDPVVKSLKKGYHILCEKPMSPKKSEIVLMGELSKKYNKILTICHVLRYSPFFIKLKELIDNDTIGKIINIQYTEQVSFWHHAHSFVRGNWNKAEQTSPMILQKSCHDMDILLWLANSKCKNISSFGSLNFFKKENKPKNAPKQCLDKCKYKKTCPFYAPKLYLKHPKYKEWGFVDAVSNFTDNKSILKSLKKGKYGRCVFECDNDVVDNQIVNLEFENNMTASFIMSAFTNDCGRTINLMGTKGQIKGDVTKNIIEIYDFLSGKNTILDITKEYDELIDKDDMLMKSFVAQVSQEITFENKTSANVSVDSHLIALAAEDSRLNAKTINFRKYKDNIYKKYKLQKKEVL